MSASRIGTPALEAREQVDDAHGRERIAGLGDGRWRDGRIGHPGRCRAERAESDGVFDVGREGGVGHVVGHLRLVH